MKTTAILSVALLSTSLFAQEPIPATSDNLTAVEMTDHAQQHLQISRTILATLKELTATLENVKDQTTADFAATKVQEIAVKMVQLQDQADNIPSLSKEQEALVKAEIKEKEVQETVHRFLVSVVQMAQVNCYESELMSDALMQILRKPVKPAQPSVN